MEGFHKVPLWKWTYLLFSPTQNLSVCDNVYLNPFKKNYIFDFLFYSWKNDGVIMSTILNSSWKNLAKLIIGIISVRLFYENELEKSNGNCHFYILLQNYNWWVLVKTKKEDMIYKLCVIREKNVPVIYVTYSRIGKWRF